MSSLEPPILSAIVARSLNGVIGVDGDLPWRLRSDLRHFKRITLGKPCIMGRKTWQSLPFPLPGRPNLVLTRDHSFQAEGAEIFSELSAIVGRAAELAGLSGQDEIMIIGGAQIYSALLPWTGRIYETVVDATIEGDAFFPTLDEFVWSICDTVQHVAGKGDDHDFVTRVRERQMWPDKS